MTKLTDNLYAVEVPKDAKIDTEVYFTGIYQRFNVESKSKGLYSQYTGLGNIKIIGTVTKDSIDFDCEPYVESEFFTLPLMEDKFYKSYKDGVYQYRTSDASFRSLLTSKGLTDNYKLVIIKSK